MKVRLIVRMSGTRDGADWPELGEVVDLPDDEARALVTAQIAEPVTGDKVEKATAPKGEQRGLTTKSGPAKQ